MAEDKKSFLLYCDMIHMVKKMPKEKAGELFLTILEYVNDEDPEPEDILVSVAFEPIKHQLKRDLKRWEQKIDKKSENGQLGNLKRWHPDLFKDVKKGKISLENAVLQSDNRKTSLSDKNNGTAINDIAKVAVTDNVTVTVNDTVINKNRANALVAARPATAENELKKKYSELLESISGKETKEVYAEIKKFVDESNPSFIEPYADAWNIVAGIYSLVQISKITDKRKNKIRTRIKSGGLDFFKVLSVIRKDQSYRGQNASGWKVTFDHIIESDDNWIKIQEKYTEQ